MPRLEGTWFDVESFFLQFVRNVQIRAPAKKYESPVWAGATGDVVT
jgi:hypothetical protein